MTKGNVQDGGKIGKGQLVNAIAEKTGLTKRQSEQAVATLLDEIVGGLRSGQVVTLPGLGTLKVTATAARTGVRPGTSEKIDIPAGRKVSFKASSNLKDNL